MCALCRQGKVDDMPALYLAGQHGRGQFGQRGQPHRLVRRDYRAEPVWWEQLHQPGLRAWRGFLPAGGHGDRDGDP